MIIKHLLRPNKTAIWIALLWTAIILFMCFKTPTIEKQIALLYGDKLTHALFYIGFVVLWFRFLLYNGYETIKTKVYLVLAAIIFGIMVELGQTYLTTTRHGDFKDVIANTIGCVIGIVIVNIIFKTKANNT